MEKTNKRRVIQLAIAILTGLVLWLYVDFQVDTETTMRVEDVPVVFHGEDTTLAEKNLMILSGYDTTIDLYLRGPRRTLWKLDESELRCVVNTGSITVTGQQQLGWTVQFPADVDTRSLKVESASAWSVQITVGELYTKEVPVEYDINGEPAAGFFLGELESDTKTLVLRAQREDLLNVSSAKVTINVSGATKTIIQTLGYTLYDYNNVPVENSDIRSATKLVQITLPVRTTKTVPLEIELMGIPEDMPEAVQHRITPPQVELIGEASTLDTITSILLDRIYVEDLGSTQTFTYEVQAPVGTMLREDTVIAEVIVTVEDTLERVVPVTNIRAENLSGSLIAQLPERLDVTVWGLESDVAEVKPEDISVRVDLSSVTEAGTYELPAKVTLKGHPGVTAEGTYRVSVTVSDKNAGGNQGGQPGGTTTPANNTNNGGQTTA